MTIFKDSPFFEGTLRGRFREKTLCNSRLTRIDNCMDEWRLLVRVASGKPYDLRIFLRKRHSPMHSPTSCILPSHGLGWYTSPVSKSQHKQCDILTFFDLFFTLVQFQQHRYFQSHSITASPCWVLPSCRTHGSIASFAFVQRRTLQQRMYHLNHQHTPYRHHQEAKQEGPNQGFCTGGLNKIQTNRGQAPSRARWCFACFSKREYQNKHLHAQALKSSNLNPKETQKYKKNILDAKASSHHCTQLVQLSQCANLPQQPNQSEYADQTQTAQHAQVYHGRGQKGVQKILNITTNDDAQIDANHPIFQNGKALTK